MFCKKCGNKIDNGIKFCKECGQEIGRLNDVKFSSRKDSLNISTIKNHLEQEIKFGSAFAVDGFGFVGRGKIKISSNELELSGKRHWSPPARFGIFLAITILPLVLFGFGLGILVALVVIHYFCASADSIVIKKSTIKELEYSKKRITFKALDEKDGKFKKTLFNALTEEQAKEIKSLLVSD